MKNNIYLILGILLIYLSAFSPRILGNTATEKKVIYFYSPTCLTCQQVRPSIEELKKRDIEVIEFEYSQNIDLFLRYKEAYGIPQNSPKGTYPLLFVGDTYVNGEEIIDWVKDGRIESLASTPLRNVEEVEVVEQRLTLFTVLGAGLLDGFNPCAIAMLLLFISLLGFTPNKRILIAISLSYISGLFFTYFALGTILFQFIHYLEREISILSTILIWGMLLFSLFFFLFNFYDGIVSLQKNYGKVKNQLPKRIKKFNAKITERFTSRLTDHQESGKSLVPLFVITFLLGVLISLTEFMCTGQVYLPIIVGLVQRSSSFNGEALLMLLLYNFMFVLPLIVLAMIAIKTQSVMTASNIIREKLYFIKFFNALLFLALFIYYLLKVI